MTDQPTPETDAQAYTVFLNGNTGEVEKAFSEKGDSVNADFARTLERQRDGALTRLAEQRDFLAKRADQIQ